MEIYYTNFPCHKLVVTQSCKSDNDNKPELQFDYIDNGQSFTISIRDTDKREIQVFSSKETKSKDLWNIFETLEKLLMIFEGEFLSIENAVFFNNDPLQDAVAKWFLSHRLHYYSSGDSAKYVPNAFVNYSEVLNRSLFSKWCRTLKALDISFNMVLYCLSNIGLPVDCKCAFLIESFIPLAERISSVRSIKLPKVKKNESELQKYLIWMLELYGDPLLSAECSANLDKFAHILTNSRNRIAHVRSRQGKLFLDGSESALYLLKLSYFYRHILFSLLGIDSSKYMDKILDSVSAFVHKFGIQDEFINKLETAAS